MISLTSELSATDVLMSNGFAVLETLLSSDKIDQILGALSRTPLNRTKAGIRHALKHETIAELAQEPQLLTFARQILGRDAEPYRATIFDKSLEANWLVGCGIKIRLFRSETSTTA